MSTWSQENHTFAAYAVRCNLSAPVEVVQEPGKFGLEYGKHESWKNMRESWLSCLWDCQDTASWHNCSEILEWAGPLSDLDLLQTSHFSKPARRQGPNSSPWAWVVSKLFLQTISMATWSKMPMPPMPPMLMHIASLFCFVFSKDIFVVRCRSKALIRGSEECFGDPTCAVAKWNDRHSLVRVRRDRFWNFWFWKFTGCELFEHENAYLGNPK